MPRRDTRLIEVTDLLETWQHRRIGLAEEFTNDGLYKFVEQMNGISKQVLNLCDIKDPEFWSAWIEIGQQCSTIAQQGKTFVNKQDRSALGL